MDGWMDGWMDVQLVDKYECTNSGHMDIYEWVDHQLKGWMDGWMDVQIVDRWTCMDAWITN